MHYHKNKKIVAKKCSTKISSFLNWEIQKYYKINNLLILIIKISKSKYKKTKKYFNYNLNRYIKKLILLLMKHSIYLTGKKIKNKFKIILVDFNPYIKDVD